MTPLSPASSLPALVPTGHCAPSTLAFFCSYNIPTTPPTHGLCTHYSHAWKGTPADLHLGALSQMGHWSLLSDRPVWFLLRGMRNGSAPGLSLARMTFFFPCVFTWFSLCVSVWKVPLFIRTLVGEGNGTPLQYSCMENPMDGRAWWAAVHGVTKSQTQLSDFTFTFHFHALQKEMATHSSVLAWRIPGTGEPGGLPSMGLHRVRHDWSNLAA